MSQIIFLFFFFFFFLLLFFAHLFEKKKVTAHGGDLLDDGSLWGSKIDDMETLARQVSRKVSDEPNVAYLEDNENEKKQKDKEEAEGKQMHECFEKVYLV